MGPEATAPSPSTSGPREKSTRDRHSRQKMLACSGRRFRYPISSSYVQLHITRRVRLLALRLTSRGATLQRHQPPPRAAFYDHLDEPGAQAVGYHAGHQLAIPAEDRVGRAQAGEPAQPATSDGPALDGQAPPLVIGEPQAPPTELLAEHAVLLT